MFSMLVSAAYPISDMSLVCLIDFSTEIRYDLDLF